MDDDVIRILVSTDNHLGFQDKSPTRYADSFAAFEEVLQTANSQHSDFVLLAGDLFHENKPSRRTVYNTLDILRKHCTGSSPVYMEIMNKQEEIFKQNSLKRVNYEDPYQSICMPIFAIHGNHDDPSRDGIGDPLSALDFFSAANLVNYIGKHEQVEDIEITPILIRKGKTTIAIYPLGAIRDERLNRMWTNKKVKFLKPSADSGLGVVINIFVLHQNRDYGRGRKNCVHETMIPEWMDVVIWGNEHECVPSMVESLAGTFRIYQPGSSVATSLSEGESSRYPKHMGLLEINLEKFRLRPIAYKQVRPFVYGDLALSSVEGLDARSAKLEETVLEVVTARVKQLIREARSLITAEMMHPEGENDRLFSIKEPRKVIVRLRVDYSGFPMNCLNLQRFGTKFIDEVANPSDIVLFARKKLEALKGGATAGASGHSTAFQSEFTAWLEGDKEAVNKIKVEDLVCDALTNQQKQLGLLAPEHLSLALEEFVIRKVPSAINDVVEETLETTQKLLRKDPAAKNKDDIQAVALRVKESRSSSARGSGGSPAARGSASTSSDTNLSPPAVQPRSRGGTTSKANNVTSAKATKSTRKRPDPEEDEEDDDEYDEFHEETKAPAKRGRANASKGKAAVPPAKKSKTAVTSARPSRASARTTKTPVYVDPDDDIDEMSLESGDESDAFDDIKEAEDDDEEELLDSSEEEDTRGRGKGKRKPTASVKKKAPATSTARAAPKSTSRATAARGKGKAPAPVIEDISDDSCSELPPTPAVTGGRGSKRQTPSNSKQQTLLNFAPAPGSTTSSSRSVRKKNTSSAMDDW